MPLFAVIPELRESETSFAVASRKSARKLLTEREHWFEVHVGTRLRGKFDLNRPDEERAGSAFAVASARPPVTYRVLSAANVLIAAGPPDIEQVLKTVDGVQIIPADQVIAEPPGTANGGMRRAPWHLDAVNAPSAHARNVTGREVLIGVADTGIDGSHPEFSRKNLKFAKFSKKGRLVSKIPVDEDPDSHGTHISALAAGTKVGVAPGADLAVANVFPSGAASFASITGGLDWLARRPRPNGTTGVDILNMSIVTRKGGKAAYDVVLKTVISYIRQLDILVLAAIGNDGYGLHASPANYAEVLGIGAFDVQGAVWSGSCGGKVGPENCEKPDLVAPGVDVYSAVGSGQYDLKTGTSCASPIAAGVAALFCQQDPDRKKLASTLVSRARAMSGGPPRVYFQ